MVKVKVFCFQNLCISLKSIANDFQLLPHSVASFFNASLKTQNMNLFKEFYHFVLFDFLM